MATYTKVKGADGVESSGYFEIVKTDRNFGSSSYGKYSSTGMTVWAQPTDASCGPSALAIICTKLAGVDITPGEILCAKNAPDANSATSTTDLTNVLKTSGNFGCETTSSLDQTKVDHYLDNGGYVTFVIKGNGECGYWSSGGHWVVIAKKQNGNYYLVDSGGTNSHSPDRFNLAFTFDNLKTMEKAERPPIYISGGNGGGTSIIWPQKGDLRRITSGFGLRDGNEFHTGLDIDNVTNGDSNDETRTLLAAADGTVSTSSSSTGYGNCIKIKVSDDITFLYGHLSSFSVNDGASVKQGDVIGIMGNTGNSKGEHLHFEIQVSKSYIDNNNIPSTPNVTGGDNYSSNNLNTSNGYYQGGSGTYYVNPYYFLNQGSMNGISNSGGGDSPSYYNGLPTAAQQSAIIESNKQQLESLNEKGLTAEIKDGSMYIDYSQSLKDYTKYNNARKIKGLQWNPSSMTRENFKQDYVVIVRKKLYFAATMTSEENYLRMYQINNFISINVSNSTSGDGKCSVTLKGGERVTCVNQRSESEKGWQSWDHILNGFTNIDDEGETDGVKWRIGSSEWNDPNSSGIDYKNIMKAKEAKYGWRYAEKCDWEPMDEIMVFSKSKSEKAENGQYKFKKIFFGYIDTIRSDFDQQGNIISISATDQLKLLRYSYTNKSASFMPGRYNNGYLDIGFDTNEFGLLKVNEPAAYGLGENELNDNYLRQYNFENVFSGIFPDEIIKNCCSAAGIPESYLNTRIEPVKVIPYIYKMKSSVDFFSTDFESRLATCQDVAKICFMEFFSDEEGNIVFKIPSYVIGTNRLATNNSGYEITDELKDKIGTKIKKGVELSTIEKLCKLVKPVVYSVEEGETVRSISKKVYGDIKYASEIQYLNLGSLQHYSTTSKLPQMDLLILSFDVNDADARKEYRSLMSNSQVSSFANDLYNKNNGYGESLNNSTVTMSMLTDILIPEILPKDIISFSMTDTDSGVYNSIDISGQTFMGLYDNDDYLKIKRTIPDLNSILRFGVRVAPPLSTPFVYDEQSAELMGHIQLLQYQAMRYTMSLKVIEDPNIKVGEPVRLFTFDEYPQKNTQYYDDEVVMAQSIYYVKSIKRNITASKQSTMTLELEAGRMLGQESVYDIMYTLYSKFYELPDDIDVITAESLYDSAKSSVGATSGSSSSSSDGDAEANNQTIYNFLIQQVGVNHAAACGMLGNLKKESTYFDPKVENSDSGAYGIVQWLGDRINNLKTYCSNNSYQYDSLDGQLNFMKYELENDYKKVLDYMKNAANTLEGAKQVAEYVCRNYEIPGNIEAEVVERKKLAEEQYNKFKT